MRACVFLDCVCVCPPAGTVNSEGSAVDAGYEVARAHGILQEFVSPSGVTVTDIIRRIMDQRELFSKRYKAKSAKEADYVANKEFVEEQ